MTRKLLSSLAIALPMAMAPLAAANAAPQILGVVASAQPTQLYCANGECVAQLTAFCLTEYRASPSKGTPYQAHNPQTIKVIGQRADGTVVPLDVAHALRFSSARNHLAVQVSLPQAIMRLYELASITLEVDDGLSLIPTAKPGDPKPITDADIQIATGPLRSVATGIVDRGGPRVEAAQLTTLLINTLPDGGRATDAARAAAWDKAFASLGVEDTKSDGLRLASQAHSQCQAETTVGFTTLRQCLASSHDIFMGKINKKYWDAVNTGS